MRNDSNYIWVYLTSFTSCFSALRAIVNQKKYRSRKWKVRKYYDDEKEEYRFSAHEKVLD